MCSRGPLAELSKQVDEMNSANERCGVLTAHLEAMREKLAVAEEAKQECAGLREEMRAAQVWCVVVRGSFHRILVVSKR